MIKYTLRMTSEQAKEVDKAVELLLRLKLNQYNELPFTLIDLDRDDFCERRDEAKELLERAFHVMQGYKYPDKFKDDEWHILYNIHQAIRYQIHLAEHPNSIGVDSYPPRSSGGKGIPECTYMIIDSTKE